MDKVFRKLSTKAVPLCFELQINGVIFPNLDAEEFQEVIITFNRSGQFENYSNAHGLVPHIEKEEHEGEGQFQMVSNFQGEKLHMFSTLYSEKGQYHTKYGEIGVFLRE